MPLGTGTTVTSRTVLVQQLLLLKPRRIEWIPGLVDGDVNDDLGHAVSYNRTRRGFIIIFDVDT